MLDALNKISCIASVAVCSGYFIQKDNKGLWVILSKLISKFIEMPRLSDNVFVLETTIEQKSHTNYPNLFNLIVFSLTGVN